MSARVVVTFVGAGPGEAGLLTVRAQQALAEAEVLVTDPEVAPAILDEAPETAERVRVAVESRGVSPGSVAALLRAHAAAGRCVVRVVSGDGEGGHGEAAILESWGIAVDVIPGLAPTAAAAWLRKRPLHGRRVLVTRPRPQAGPLASRLEAHGAEVILLPAIRIEPPEDWGPADAAIGSLGDYRWVVFTSANGVAAFRQRLTHAGLDVRVLAGRQVAAIGPETAEGLRRRGIEPDVVPDEYRAEGLLDALAPRLGPGDRVLLLRAAEARDVLPRELEARGNPVTVAPVYRTVLAEGGTSAVRELLESGRLDAVTFTSSSTVRGFLALLGAVEARRLLEEVVVAAIGPITAATAAEHGLRVTVVPDEYTIPALADAIAGHFETSPPAALRG